MRVATVVIPDPVSWLDIPNGRANSFDDSSSVDPQDRDGKFSILSIRRNAILSVLPVGWIHTRRNYFYKHIGIFFDLGFIDVSDSKDFWSTLFSHDESRHLLCHHCVASFIIDNSIHNHGAQLIIVFYLYYFLSPSIAMVAMDLSSPGDAPALALTLMPV